MAVSVVRNLCQMGLVGNGCRRDIAVAERMRARGPVGRQVAVVYGWLSGYLCKLGWYVPAPDFAIVLFGLVCLLSLAFFLSFVALIWR